MRDDSWAVGQHLSDSKANRGSCAGDAQSHFNQLIEADTKSHIDRDIKCRLPRSEKNLTHTPPSSSHRIEPVLAASPLPLFPDWAFGSHHLHHRLILVLPLALLLYVALLQIEMKPDVFSWDTLQFPLATVQRIVYKYAVLIEWMNDWFKIEMLKCSNLKL